MDGANVMLSDKNGVNGLHLRENPYAVAMHCVNHRLALTVSKAAEAVADVKVLQVSYVD